MRAFVPILAGFLCGALLGACGPAPAQKSNIIPVRDLKEAQQIGARNQVSCADPTNCSESVALLTISTEQNVSLCTSFLVAPDVVATNSHCVPEDLRKPGSACANRLWIRFPDAPSRPGESAGCASVLAASPKKRLADPDYAFLRLDHALSRPSLPVSRQGLADGHLYVLDKVNPVSTTEAVGVLERTRCRTPQRTLITPDFDSELAPVATLAECEVVHGNSGSPLLDETGHVRAIAQATMEPDRIRDTLSRRGIHTLDGAIAPLGLATNLACLRLPGQDPAAPLPPACAGLASRPETLLSNPSPSGEDLQKSLENEVQAALEHWAASASGSVARLSWQDEPVPAGTAIERDLLASYPAGQAPTSILTLNPRCFRQPLGWMSADQPSRELEVEIPLWSLEAGVNRYLQPERRLVALSRTLHARLSFSPAQLLGNGAMTAVKLTSGGEALFDGAIPRCPTTLR